MSQGYGGQRKQQTRRDVRARMVGREWDVQVGVQVGEPRTLRVTVEFAHSTYCARHDVGCSSAKRSGFFIFSTSQLLDFSLPCKLCFALTLFPSLSCLHVYIAASPLTTSVASLSGIETGVQAWAFCRRGRTNPRTWLLHVFYLHTL